MGAMKDFDRRIRQGGDDAVRAALEYALTVAARWIPAEERLPEEGRLVLWYRPDERWPVTSGRFERPHHVNDGGDLCVPFSEGRYTHWMPLPEPPEVK